MKVIFRASASKLQEGSLYYRIIHKRKVRQIHSGSRVFRDEWNSIDGCVAKTGNPSRDEYLSSISKKLNDSLTRIQRIVAAFELSGKEYSVDEIVGQYHDIDAVVGFLTFARKIISENKRMGKFSASEHYSSALNSFIRFNGDEEISFDELTPQLINHYECYLKSIGLCPNTTSYYMRKLRAMYNQAVDRGLVVQRNPFKYVYTGVAKTVKRAVTLNVIKSLRRMDLKFDPISAMARDMFLFSFCTRGMSIVDMAYLKKKNLQNGILVYRRRKTSQQLSIRWEGAMQDIVDRYVDKDSDYLLPLIKDKGKDARRQYLNAAHLINRRLKKLGNQLGLMMPLTMYVARHAWASIAHDNNISISVISQGMGHDSEKTTRIYLATLDTSALDKANNDIISLLDS